MSDPYELLMVVGIFLIPLLITVALFTRRVSGGYPESEDHQTRTRTLDFWIGVCLAISISTGVCITVLANSVTNCEIPPIARTAMEFQQLDYALADCLMATGSAPTTIGDLKTLRGTYLETDESLDKLLDTGIDCWGNPLIILPVAGKHGQFTLRSTGPDGRIDMGPKGDDIIVTYTAN